MKTNRSFSLFGLMCSCDERGYILVSSMVLLFVLLIVALSAMQTTTMEQQVTINSANATLTRQGSEWGRTVISDVLIDHFAYRGWPAPMGTLTAGLFNVPAKLFVRSTAATVTSCTLIGTTLPTTLPASPVSLAVNDGTGAQLSDSKMAAGVATSILDFRCPDARLTLSTRGTLTNAGASIDDTVINIYVMQLGTVLGAGASVAESAGYEGTGKGSASGGGVTYLDVRACSSSDLTLGGQCRSASAASVVLGAQYQMIIR
ncbi:MAG: hypothetical protein HQL77_09370 [Magnetococcales bacterium]|nr:hypothetical protein [Magnetococcales bacterium]